MSESNGLQLKPDHLCAVLSGWTGIPTARLRGWGAAFFDIVLEQVREAVFGQDDALREALRALGRRCRLPRPAMERRPLWSTIFAGPSGVGKTVSARAIGELVFGSSAIVIDCSEFAHEHQISRLVGAPPSYVGYGAPGQLVAALEGRGSGLLLFDEVDKAHDVLWRSVLLPLIEEGVVHDMSSGRALYATEWMVVLTANPGWTARANYLGFLDRQDDTHRKHTRQAVEERFPPELLGRVDDVIVFGPLSERAIRCIWDREERALRDRFLSMEPPVRLRVAETAREFLLARVESPFDKQGARAVMRLFRSAILDHCLALVDGGQSGASTLLVECAGERLRYRLEPGAAIPAVVPGE
jgi:ATP-dependent Clp protease ATP-binding subunit ClpC